MPFFNLIAFIYSTAIFFWIRYLYKYSLKKTVDRTNFFKSIKEIILFIPIGLQAIMLFCFAFGQTIPLSVKFSNFIEFIFFEQRESVLPDFEPIRIIFIGSLLVVFQYYLLKVKLYFIKGSIRIYQIIIFISNIFFLNNLISNIRHSLFYSLLSNLVLNYNNFYIWMLCLLLVFIFGSLKGKWIQEKQINLLKYLSITSRILLLYSILIIIVALPLIIFSFL